MATELENSIRNAAEKIAQYVDDVATLTVETRFVQIEGDAPVNFDQARPAARTVIRLDGDSQSVIPLRREDTGLEVDRALYELHQRNVATAIEYRARILQALWGALQTRLP